MVQNWKTMPKTIKTLGFISICISVLIALNQASVGFERKSVGESLIQDAKKLLFIFMLSISFVSLDFECKIY